MEIEWVEADAEDLPFEDARFDCVGSVFGAMIAPRPRVAAEEMFRVVKPGGTVGMTAWMASGANYDLFSVGRRYAPPPEPGEEAPPGSRSGRTRRPCASASRASPRASRSRSTHFPGRATRRRSSSRDMERSAPPQVAAKANMPPDLYAQMREELLEVARGWAGGDGPFSVDGRLRRRSSPAGPADPGRPAAHRVRRNRLRRLGDPAGPAHGAGDARGRACATIAREPVAAHRGGAHRRRRARPGAGGQPPGHPHPRPAAQRPAARRLGRGEPRTRLPTTSTPAATRARAPTATAC